MLDKLAYMGIAKSAILHTAQSLFHDHAPAKALGLARCWIDRRMGEDGSGATKALDEIPDVHFHYDSMAALVDVIEQENVQALFHENMTNQAIITQLAEETGLPIAGTLYADALASEGDASTYLGMMRHNAQVLHDALAEPGHDDHGHDDHDHDHDHDHDDHGHSH